jgi:hypothetical protein
MNVLILTSVGTVLAAMVESLIYYVRFKNSVPHILRRALVGALVWGIGIAALRWNRAPLATILVHGAVGSILWFVVVFALGRVLWHSASRSPHGTRSQR